MNKCPHCDGEVFSISGDGERLKARTTILVLHKGGDVETNCPQCKRAIILPLQAIPGESQLRKGKIRTRHTLKKALDTRR